MNNTATQKQALSVGWYITFHSCMDVRLFILSLRVGQ